MDCYYGNLDPRSVRFPSILLKQEGEEEKRETGKEMVAMVAIPQADLKGTGSRLSACSLIKLLFCN